MDNLLYFPLRRICALGVPSAALAAVHEELPFISIHADGAALQRCDLLVINESDHGATELVAWVRERLPQFPVVFWSTSVRLADDCRRLLFAGEPSAR